MKPIDIKVGDVVQFVYDRGTHPEAIRTVEVDSVEGDCIKGHDYYVGDWRRFKFVFMRGLQPLPVIDKSPTIKKKRVEMNVNGYLSVAEFSDDALEELRELLDGLRNGLP